MPQQLKLDKPGDELVMTPTAITVATRGDHTYVDFTDGVVEVAVPMSSVERQLERLDVVRIEDAVGRPLRISRSTKVNTYGKPYWNLDVASPADQKAKPAPKRMAAPPPPQAAVATWSDTVAAMRACWLAAEKIQGDAGSPESKQAMAATLMIHAQKVGVMPQGAAAARTATAGGYDDPPPMNDEDNLPF